ncbi:MAG: class I SAM-dependent methyltransferase [Actinobacteria bacterium]|nr:class I SAM-dependent methyltransferase [Actinomycetota bacterium]
MQTYYDRRAREYDDWVYGTGLFADRDRPDWHEERSRLEQAVAKLPAVRSLDVGCGTGWLTQRLQGEVMGLDASEGMIAIAQERIPGATFVVGDALDLPFEDGAFDRVFTGHFYGHLEEDDRQRFLTEARRVAHELVVVDSALRNDVDAEERQERVLTDGSRWEVFKRYFTPEGLAEELGSGRVLHSGRWFVMVSSVA